MEEMMTKERVRYCLRIARVAAGLRLQEVADQAQVARPRLSAFERGKVELTSEDLTRVQGAIFKAKYAFKIASEFADAPPVIKEWARGLLDEHAHGNKNFYLYSLTGFGHFPFIPSYEELQKENAALKKETEELTGWVETFIKHAESFRGGLVAKDQRIDAFRKLVSNQDEMIAAYKQRIAALEAELAKLKSEKGNG